MLTISSLWTLLGLGRVSGTCLLTASSGAILELGVPGLWGC